MSLAVLHPDAQSFTPAHTLAWEPFSGEYSFFNFITPRGLLTFNGISWQGYHWWWSTLPSSPPVLKHCAALLFYPLTLPTPVLLLTGGLNASLAASQLCIEAWASLDFGFRSSRVEISGRLLEERFLHTAVQVEEQVVVIGGQRREVAGMRYLKSCEVGWGVGKGGGVRWERGPEMNRGRSTFSSLLFRKSLYVFGGFRGSGLLSHDIEFLPPSRHSWRLLVLKPVILAGVSPLPVDQSIWLIGGSDGYSEFSSILVFHPDSETVEPLKCAGELVGLSGGVAKGVVREIAGKVIVVGDKVETVMGTVGMEPPCERIVAVAGFGGRGVGRE